MNNCIFTPHCVESYCDQSCPAYVESSYLLERNNIRMTSPVFKSTESDILKMITVLDKFNQSTGGLIVNDTVKYSELLTYCAICRNWQGSKLHCTVYNLKYSSYLEELKKSWSGTADTSSLEYIQIWMKSAKVLIISNFDYVSFGDFESQTLLNLIQERTSSQLTTILVGPQKLIGKKSLFFNLLFDKYLNPYNSNKPESNILIFEQLRVDGGVR